ncbi:MAG TPA: hypothetical protein VHY20_00945 [Pirellulales bacterium]|nr:hypothetical protein [Pirellulales bacterium]
MDPIPNPYQTPTTTHDGWAAAAQSPVKVPPEILAQIKWAWVCALITGGMTAVFALTNMLPGGNFLWIDVMLVMLLAFGIYRRSRACAVAMFVYFIISKLSLLSTMNAVAWIVAAGFGYCYFGGIRGTFAYHRLMRDAELAAPGM